MRSGTGSISMPTPRAPKSVAAAQVVDHVLRPRACELEHTEYGLVGAREIRHLRIEYGCDPVGEFRVAEPVEHGAARHEQCEAEKNEPGTDHGFAMASSARKPWSVPGFRRA